MPRPFLSRPLVALASLAVASATLVAAPADAKPATTANGITRVMVLTAAKGIRASLLSSDDPTLATKKAVRAIVLRACAVNTDDGEILVGVDGAPTVSGASADGLVAYGQIADIVTGSSRDCVAGVIASSTPDRLLTGTVTVSIKVSGGAQTKTTTAPLSSDVAVTKRIDTTSNGFSGGPSLTAKGAAVKTIRVPAKTVKDVKTSKEKKAAKKTYAKRLAAAKKSYAKALKKAGGSTSKKTAAKKAYVARKKSAKAKYRYAIANYRIVEKARTVKDVRPFSLGLLLL